MAPEPTRFHRRTLLLGALGLPACAGARAAGDPAAGEVSWATVVLVRHAEKESAGEDPDLSEAGVARSEALSRLLQNSAPSHLFSSEYLRTRRTLAPLEQATGLEPLIHPARDAAGQAARLRALPPGSLAVLCGHSNTLPQILATLGAPLARLDPKGHIEESTYHRLFILTLLPPSSPALLELRYDP